MALHLTDLDELALKVRHPESKKYIEEAINAYRSKAYRSSIVAIWTAVCTDIILKIRDLALGGDKAALPFNEEINKILEIPNANEAAKEMQKFESRILEIAVSPLGFLTLIEKQHLERLKQDRNLCAHPALTRDGELFIPPPEMTRLYIVQSCSYLLCQAPTQGKVVIEKILKLIGQPEFPTEIEEVQNALADPIYLGKAKESTLKSFLIEMLKILLLEDTANNEEFQRKVALSVSAIKFINKDIYSEIFQVKFPNLINEVDIQKLKFIFLLLSEDVELWDKLHPSTQTKLIQLVKNFSYDEFRKYEIIECGKNIISVRQGLFEGLEALEPMEKIDSIYYNPDAYLKEYAINTFVNSWSFDLAEASFRKCVFPYIGILNTTDLESILKGALNNKSPYDINQILKARSIPHLFKKFYEALKTRNLTSYKEIWANFWGQLKTKSEVSNFHALKELLENDGVIPVESYLLTEDDIPF